MNEDVKPVVNLFRRGEVELLETRDGGYAFNETPNEFHLSFVVDNGKIDHVEVNDVDVVHPVFSVLYAVAGDVMACCMGVAASEIFSVHYASAIMTKNWDRDTQTVKPPTLGQKFINWVGQIGTSMVTGYLVRKAWFSKDILTVDLKDESTAKERERRYELALERELSFQFKDDGEPGKEYFEYEEKNDKEA